MAVAHDASTRPRVARPPASCSANFFVVGAPRCGTTSLHYYLGQHPEIEMSTIKEPNHYLFDPALGRRFGAIADRRIRAKSVTSRRKYRRLFRTEAPLKGDASPLYLYTRETPPLIRACAPGARVIAVLRDPVERAWSHFLNAYAGPKADALPTFLAAVEREQRDLAYSPYQLGHHFLRLGLYAPQLQRFYDEFDPDDVLVLRYDDLVAAPDIVLEEIFAFLGAGEFEVDTSVVYNASTPISRLPNAHLRRLVRVMQPYLKRVLPRRVVARLGRSRASGSAAPQAPREPLPPEVEALRPLFAEDLAMVHRMTGIAVRDWL